MEYNSNKNITKLVDDFISEMHQRTGASRVFLISVKPAVRKMFQTTRPDALNNAKEFFVKKAEVHVQTLEHLSATLNHLQKLSEKEKNDPIFNPTMARQLAFTKGIVVNTLLKTYGGFGTKVTICC